MSPSGKENATHRNGLSGARRSFLAEMPRNTRNIPSANASLGPEETASTGGLNRNYIAFNVWWRAAASNLEERPETAGNGRVWREFDAAAAGWRRENLLRLLLVTVNFLPPGATAPKQGRGTPTSRFRPLNLRVSARAITLRSRYYGKARPVRGGRELGVMWSSCLLPRPPSGRRKCIVCFRAAGGNF